MKDQNNTSKTSFFKKIFIKICRLFGYEIIDQSKYEVPTLSKKLNDSLSTPGKRSITITCCVIDWGGEEWKLYMKNATYLQIKRNDSSKSRLNINKAKGNYVN